MIALKGKEGFRSTTLIFSLWVFFLTGKITIAQESLNANQTMDYIAHAIGAQCTLEDDESDLVPQKYYRDAAIVLESKNSLKIFVQYGGYFLKQPGLFTGSNTESFREGHFYTADARELEKRVKLTHAGISETCAMITLSCRGGKECISQNVSYSDYWRAYEKLFGKVQKGQEIPFPRKYRRKNITFGVRAKNPPQNIKLAIEHLLELGGAGAADVDPFSPRVTETCPRDLDFIRTVAESAAADQICIGEGFTEFTVIGGLSGALQFLQEEEPCVSASDFHRIYAKMVSRFVDHGLDCAIREKKLRAGLGK